MPDIDAEATGILIENGVDPFTAVAASVIEGSRPPARPAKHHRLVAAIAIVATVAAVAFCGWLF
jgi:hypothetical protein